MLTKSGQSRVGTAVFTVIILLPVVFWVSKVGLGSLIDSPAQFVMSIGKLCAFVGIAAYSLNPVLSMRHWLIEKAFGGLDTVYMLHKKSGKISFFIILGHPTFLGAGGLMAGKGIGGVWDWTSLVVISGIVALVAVTALTVIAIYAHIKHQKWVVIHRLFGWLIPVMFAHALLARSQLAQNNLLLIYMLTIGSLGICAFLYRSVFRFLVKKYRYVVAEVNAINPAVTELVLKPLGVPLSYTPGQFAFVGIEGDSFGTESHPFSFTTANNGPYVRFVIKALGDDTAKVKDIQPGAKAFLEGPYGSFSIHASRRMHQVWIAGGVGITPFLAMARSLHADAKKRIHLFYASDKLEDAVFLKELIEIQKMIPDVLEVTLVNKEWSGFVSMEILEKYVEDFGQNDYLICGPPVMMHTLRGGLLKKGVPQSHIHIEEFSM